MAKPRNLHIDGLVWRYVVGKSTVAVWSPEGKKTTFPLSKVLGYDQAAIDRARAIGPAERPRVPVAARREVERRNRAFNVRIRAEFAVGQSQRGSRYRWRSLSEFLLPEKVTGSRRAWYGPLDKSISWEVKRGMVRPSDVKSTIEARLMGRGGTRSGRNMLCGCCLTHIHGVRLRVDPYAYEIKGDDTQVPLCDDCADLSAHNI